MISQVTSESQLDTQVLGQVQSKDINLKYNSEVNSQLKSDNSQAKV